MSHPPAFEATLDQLKAHRMVGEARRYYREYNRFDLFHGNPLRLEEEHKRIERQALLQLKALLEVHDALSAEMPLLHFKGLTLGHLLYGEVTVRECKDLDILIPPKKWQEAYDILKGLGYTCPQLSDHTRPCERDYIVNTLKDFTFRDQKNQIELEIHTRFYPWTRFGPNDLEQIPLQDREVPFYHRSISVMSPVHYLYYLIIHGARSAYKKMHWLCDVIQFMNIQPVDWEELTGLFVRYKTEPLLLFTSELSRSCFDTEIPTEAAGINRSTGIMRHVNRLLRLRTKLLSSMPLHSPDNHPSDKSYALEKWFYFNLKKDLCFKKEWYLYNFSLLSSFKLIKLPCRLFWLYEIFKPFFYVFLKVFKRMNHHGTGGRD